MVINTFHAYNGVNKEALKVIEIKHVTVLVNKLERFLFYEKIKTGTRAGKK